MPPVAAARGATIMDFGVDPKGTLWALTANRVFWWNGTTWVQASASGQPLGSGACLTHLFGGSDRGLYLTQRGAVEHYGLLYRLEAGEATKVGPFYYDSSGSEPGIYVGRSGRLFNWSKRSLAAWVDGKWHTTEVEMGAQGGGVSIADFGPEGPVFFLGRPIKQGAIWDGKRFHADLALPEALMAVRRQYRGARWGADRVFLWPYKNERAPTVAVRISEGRLEPIDISATLKALGAFKYIVAGWTVPDGALWLILYRNGGRYYEIAKLLPDGRVELLGEHYVASSLSHDYAMRARPQWVVHARDGTLWAGSSKGGIVAVRGKEVTAYDWRVGVIAQSIRVVAQAPDGRVYAAASPHAIYRWHPAAEPDRSATEVWDEVRDRCWLGPMVDLDGNLWVHRESVRDHVGMWDGKRWTWRRVPYAPEKLIRWAIDDTGHLIVERGEKKPRVFVVGPKGSQSYPRLHEAFAARVEAGAKRFRSGDSLVGPVVTRDRQIWFGLHRYSTLHARRNRQWQDLRLSGVHDVGLDDKGRAVFLTSQAVWRLEGGRFVPISTRDELRTRRLWLAPRVPRRRGVSFVPGLPPSLRERYQPIARLAARKCVPVSWEAAMRIYDGGQPSWSGRAAVRTLSSADFAGPAPGGGAWIKDSTVDIYRWLDDVLVRLDTRRTPVAGRVWNSIGVTPTGGVWMVTWPRKILLRKPIEEPPKIAIRSCTVEHGRRIQVYWEPLPQGVAAAVVRTSLDERWRAIGDGASSYLITTPGRREVRIEARAMDAIGLLGPPTVHKVTVDVRLPALRWDGKPPSAINDIVWVVPVKPTWSAPDAKRRIEWRVGDGPWQPLRADRRLPVAHLNNKSVEFHFRAVEEDVFVSPAPLSVRVPVEMVIDEAIRRRIEHVLHGTEAERRLAIDDLKAAPADARRLLQRRLSELHAAASRGRAALSELQQAQSRPAPR